VRRFVLFDLDDTLIDRQRALRTWIADFGAKLRLGAGLSAQAGADVEAWLGETFAAGARPWHFQTLRERLALAESADQLWRRYYLDLAERVHCPPAVLAGLDELRDRGWAVGVLTNGPVDAQQVKLRRTGIVEHVDAWCISGELGVHKPDAAVFAEAIRRCGIPEDGVGWMVGDNPVADIGGGRAAGLRTIWISGGRPWPGPGPDADLTVPDAAAAIRVLLTLDGDASARR